MSEEVAKHLGYVLCCKGKRTMCYGNADFWNGVPKGAEYDKLRLCAKEHEEEHMRQCVRKPDRCVCKFPEGRGYWVDSDCGMSGPTTEQIGN